MFVHVYEAQVPVSQKLDLVSTFGQDMYQLEESYVNMYGRVQRKLGKQRMKP